MLNWTKIKENEEEENETVSLKNQDCSTNTLSEWKKISTFNCDVYSDSLFASSFLTFDVLQQQRQAKKKTWTKTHQQQETSAPWNYAHRFSFRVASQQKNATLRKILHMMTVILNVTISK